MVYTAMTTVCIKLYRQLSTDKNVIFRYLNNWLGNIYDAVFNSVAAAFLKVHQQLNVFNDVFCFSKVAEVTAFSQ